MRETTGTYWDFESEARKSCDKMPWLSFPENWEVRLIFPFGGTVQRLLIREKGKKNGHVSVYADWFGNTGCYGPLDDPQPFWEVYPHDGDVGRVDLDDAKGLLKMISESLKELSKSK